MWTNENVPEGITGSIIGELFLPGNFTGGVYLNMEAIDAIITQIKEDD